MSNLKIILAVLLVFTLAGCEAVFTTNTPTPAPATAVPTATLAPTEVPTATPTPPAEENTPIVPTPAPVTAAPTDDLSDVDEVTPALVDISHYMAGSYYKGGDGFRDAVDLTHVTSSSVLSPQAGNTYDPENLYDFDLNTVWCEGRTSHGVGEWAEYRVRAFEYAPNAVITKIEVINGYIKTDDLFDDNSMVKKMLVVVDDENWCILNFARVKQIQQFDVPDIDLDTDDDVVIKFVILEVYEGDVYADTCVTAIEFSGTGIY